MKLLAEMVIPQMFTAYAEDQGHLHNGLHHYQYFCEECDQIFASAWGRKPGTYPPVERGASFVCPNCGQMHENHVVYIDRKEKAPNKIRLAVKEFKSVIALEVSSKTVYFNDYLSLYAGNYKEIFRFDIPKQTVSFSSYDTDGSLSETIELGNPFKLDILSKSILRFFIPISLANSEHKSKLNQTLKVLRESVRRKLEKHLGHKVSSAYVSPGQNHGTFLLPIFNLAYRVTCPDAPNLPTEFREEPEMIQDFLSKRLLDCDLMDNVIALTRQKRDFVKALIVSQPLPNKPSVRRLLSVAPFNVALLAKAFEVCKNYDYALQLHESLMKVSGDTRVRWVIKENLFQFLQEMRPIYGEAGIVYLVENYIEIELRDCINLFQQLTDENRKAFETESVRLRDIHDWMSLRHKKQSHKNLKFDVPEHIVKRLSMQKEQLKFFLPKESMQLLEAGCELHNCVASYGAAMKDNKKWIVLVADDNGKLVACLEINGKELVQAKLDRNMPASCNAQLNQEIVAWAGEAGIKVKTPDIKMPSEQEIRVRVPA